MDLEEMLELEAKCYVAMAEIDYDLIRWHRRHYSPSLAINRSMIDATYKMGQTMRAFNRKMKEKLDAEVSTRRDGS